MTITLPLSTHTRPFSQDHQRFSDERALAWEAYTHFGRRLGLWRHDRCGTLPPEEVTRFVASREREGVSCWCRLVTYRPAT